MKLKVPKRRPKGLNRSPDNPIPNIKSRAETLLKKPDLLKAVIIGVETTETNWDLADFLNDNGYRNTFGREFVEASAGDLKRAYKYLKSQDRLPKVIV